MEYGDNYVHPYFVSLINTVHPLSCYAARVIRRYGIPFDENRIPVHLQPFVACHSAKGKLQIKEDFEILLMKLVFIHLFRIRRLMHLIALSWP
jgi:hypothetical protein